MRPKLIDFRLVWCNWRIKLQFYPLINLTPCDAVNATALSSFAERDRLRPFFLNQWKYRERRGHIQTQDEFLLSFFFRKININLKITGSYINLHLLVIIGSNSCVFQLKKLLYIVDIGIGPSQNEIVFWRIASHSIKY